MNAIDSFIKKVASLSKPAQYAIVAGLILFPLLLVERIGEKVGKALYFLTN